MTELVLSIEQLRGMIGLRMRHQGVLCQVIEVLEDGPSLVLQNCDEGTTIQPNIYGEANRRVPLTYTVPVLTGDRLELHPAFLALDLE